LLAVVAALLLSLGLVACGDDDGGGQEQAATTETTEPTEATAETSDEAAGCKEEPAPAAKEVKLKKPKAKLDPSKTYTVEFKTSCGDFTIELDAKNSPKTAASVKHMADEGLYDGTTFHRVVPGFVIQGGDPEGTGSGGPGYSVVEAPDSDVTYKEGLVAMAKAGEEEPGTSGSQFFIVTGPQAEVLDPDYAVAGKLASGDETVENISSLGTGDGPPSKVVVIYSAKSKVK
jgi:peptidyl-prolyl cis-trans isomerase B (cyclophilin B)